MPDHKKLQRIAKERGMSQGEVSRRSGIQRSNITHIFNHDKNVTETTLLKLIKALDCRLEDICLEEK